MGLEKQISVYAVSPDVFGQGVEYPELCTRNSSYHWYSPRINFFKVAFKSD